MVKFLTAVREVLTEEYLVVACQIAKFHRKDQTLQYLTEDNIFAGVNFSIQTLHDKTFVPCTQ